MANLNLKPEKRKRKRFLGKIRRFLGKISLLELLTYIAAGVYYITMFIFIGTVIIAGWKYILS